MSTLLIWAGVWLVLGLVFIFLWAALRALDKRKRNDDYSELSSRFPRLR